jgi:hypothetical protein
MATEKRLIDASEVIRQLEQDKELFLDGWGGFSSLPPKDKARVDELDNCISRLFNAPTVDAVPVSAEELRHLINDTLAYIWKMESDGRENLTESRKTLLEKLKRFEKEHFPEIACSCGERKDNEN